MPPVGGDTLFASQYAAYDALSPRMKAYLEGLTATHSGDHVYRRNNALMGLKETGKTYPRASHPVVRTHPVTKRKALYVNGDFTTHIDGLPREEGRAILEFLCEFATREEFQVRFRWRPHSVAFWDNRCVQHQALWDYYPQTRSGRRVTIKGDRPFFTHRRGRLEKREPMTDIRIYSGGAPKEALNVLTPQFEAADRPQGALHLCGDRELQKKLAAGDIPDMVVMPVPAIDGWSRPARCKALPRGVLGSVGIGVIVREGAPHPEISTPEAFKNALLKGALGRARQSECDAERRASRQGRGSSSASPRRSRPKLTLSNALDGGVQRITAGEAEIGIYPVSEVISVKGIALVGLLPPALQSMIVYGVAVPAASAAPEPAGAFIAFLTDGAHRAVWERGGVRPPK